MISRELQITLNLAVSEARRRKHEYLTLEHVLYALLHDQRGTEIIEACGGRREPLKKQLEDFFDQNMETLEGDEPGAPEQTLAFQRTVQRAAYQVQSSGAKEMDAGNILASMFREEDSHAVYLLEQQNLSRLDVLNYITHGIRKTASGKPVRQPRPTRRPDAEEEGESQENPLEAWCLELVAEETVGRYRVWLLSSWPGRRPPA